MNWILGGLCFILVAALVNKSDDAKYYKENAEYWETEYNSLTTYGEQDKQVLKLFKS